MKTGFGMLLKAMGVDIDPVQIGEFIAQAQVAIPQFINRTLAIASNTEARVARMERNQARIMAALGIEQETEAPAALQKSNAA